jgi:predicted ferric reductase
VQLERSFRLSIHEPTKESRIMVSPLEMNAIARIVPITCLLWSLVWVSFGATSRGKLWYTQFTLALFPQDTKGGLPLVVLAIPVLLSAAVIQLLATREPEVNPHFRIQALRMLQNKLFLRGDINYTRASALIIIPCLLYALLSTKRHFQEGNLDWNEKLKTAANAQGMAAMIAMSFLFLPVARCSAFLRVMHWNPACAVQLHIWTGRCVIFCSLLHGIMHLARWKWTLLGEDWTTLLFPPAPCWTMQTNSDFAPTCRNIQTDCTCYHLFRNLTGLLAGIGLLVILLSSFNIVRRNMYTAFYKIHVLAGPLVIVMIVLHYNRAMLYMAGGLLFYVASSFPVLVESKWRQQQGVKVVGFQTIDESDKTADTITRPCISLTVQVSDAAMAQFRACQYIRLRGPAISSKAHPFSVNIVPDQSNQLRVIFRCVGPFTSKLASQLKSPKGATVHMDGFYGPGNRVEQALQHDTIVIVAGGIGITSYLSLLHRIHSTISCYPKRFPLRRVILHWMCRDPSLTDFVTQEYLEPLQRLPSCPGLTIQTILHHTRAAQGDYNSDCLRAIRYDLENPQDDLRAVYETVTRNVVLSNGIAFTPSQFAPVSRARWRQNLLPFAAFAFTSVVGLKLIWYFYVHVQSDDIIMSRIWSLIAVIAIGLAVAVIANVVVSRLRHDDQLVSPAEWTALSTSEHDSLELSHMMPWADDCDNGQLDAVVPVGEADHQTVSIEERHGRPSIHQFLNVFDNARQPGLFACGPERMLKQVRVVVEDRCAARLRQCIKGGAKIALYEESFQT